MRRLRALAEATPAGRERIVDLLRALAIVMVVLGHWVVATIGYDTAGRPTARSALPDLPWAYPLTWIAQVMPVFFLVGGYANAASLAARRGRGGDATGWLLDRAARLLRPTTALLVTLAAGAAVASLAGAPPALVRAVVYYATIPLWFLAAYLLVVPLTPAMTALHRRFGLIVPVGLAALVAAGDLGRALGPAALAMPNYLFGWLAVHQLGIAWHDARAARSGREPAGASGTGEGGGTGRVGGAGRPALPLSRRAGAGLLAGGLGATVLLTTIGPYPVVMLNVPGERLDNAAPPSLALLTLATAQVGLILLVRDPVERWLHRTRPWLVVIAVNAVVLTVFLWHLTAAILLVGALDAIGRLPTPPAGSAAWFAGRLPWVLLLAVILAVLVAVFGRVEARTGRGRADARAGRAWIRTSLTVVAYVAVVYALVANARTSRSAPEPLGLPVPALVAYVAGAGTLRLLRTGSGSRG